MSTLYITEFSNPGIYGGTPLATGTEPAVTSQTLGISATSAASSAFQNNTTLVRLHTDAICSVAFGTSPTATSTSRRMAANQTEYYTVPVSSAYKVAVITNV